MLSSQFIILVTLTGFKYLSPSQYQNMYEYKEPRNVSDRGSYNFISVLSLCAEKDNQINSTALMLHLSIKSQFQLDRSYLGYPLKYKVGYISYDVCEDMIQLIHLLTSFVLDRKYREKDFGTKCRKKDDCTFGRVSSNILAVIAYLPTDMLIQTANILLSEGIVLITITESDLFADSLLYPFYIPWYQSKSVPYYLSTFFNHYQFKHFGFICIRFYPTQECPDLHELWNYMEDKNDMKCMTYYTLDVGNETQMIDFLITLNSSVSPSILLLSGDTEQKANPSLLRKAQEMSIKGKVWMISSKRTDAGLDSLFRNLDDAVYLYFPKHNLLSRQNLQNYFMTSTYGLTDKWLMKFTNSSFKLEYPDADLFSEFSILLIKYVHSTLLTYFIANTQWNKTLTFDLLSYQMKARNQLSLDLVNFHTKHGGFTTFSISNIPEEQLKWIKNSKFPPKSICPKHPCQPGWGIKFGLSKYSLSNWHKEYGWTCNRCEANSIQPLHAHDNCTLCTGVTAPDINQISCVDTFTNQDIALQDIGVVVTLVIAGLGFLYDLILLIVFIKYRKTPCVRSSDFVISVYQIIISSMIYIGSPFLMITKPTFEKCLIRPILTGFCFSVAIGVALSKVQKILNAFKAKVRQSSKEVILTKATQIFIIYLAVLGHGALLAITFIQSPATVNIKMHYTTKIREIYCNTDSHTQVQIFYLFFLLLFSSIQGFRGRSLPSNFNETKYIAFATFTTNICFLVMFPLYYSQTYHKDKMTVEAILIVLAKCLFSMIFYTNKLYVILIRPDLNDPKKYRKNMMEKMAQNATKLV